MKPPPFAAFRAALCLSTALMMAISWPLWVSGGLFPKVPFFGWVRLLPEWASWVRFVISLAAMLAASAGFRWRSALGMALALSAWMVLEDQFRLQPWMYQFLLMGFALIACPERQAMGLCRLFMIAMYFHSGLSKLDESFVREMGQSFLVAGTRLAGLNSQRWPAAVQNACIVGMPCWEIAVAAGFLLRARKLATFGAVIQHLALIAILGPWAINHSANVLIWNVVLIAEVLLLFTTPVPLAPTVAAGRPLAGVAKYAMVAAACLPFGERRGLWDAWPSFALYASHVERVDIMLVGRWQERLPNILTRNRDVVKAGFPFTWLNLGSWSLDARRAPAYPSARAMCGVAEAIVNRYGEDIVHNVFIHNREEERQGKRMIIKILDMDALRRHNDSYWLNAHPAP